MKKSGVLPILTTVLAFVISKVVLGGSGSPISNILIAAVIGGLIGGVVGLIQFLGASKKLTRTETKSTFNFDSDEKGLEILILFMTALSIAVLIWRL